MKTAERWHRMAAEFNLFCFMWGNKLNFYKQNNLPLNIYISKVFRKSLLNKQATLYDAKRNF